MRLNCRADAFFHFPQFGKQRLLKLHPRCQDIFGCSVDGSEQSVGRPVKDWEIITDNLNKAVWRSGWLSAIDCDRQRSDIADAHRNHDRRFVLRADEKLPAFIELTRRSAGGDCLDNLAGFYQPPRRYKDLNPGQGKESSLSVFSSPLSDLQCRVNYREKERKYPCIL